MSILEVNHIKKVYKTRMGGDEVTALRDVHFSVEPGEFVAIMGESGSGKTTLLNILASLDTPTAGKVLVDGKDFTTLKDNERAIFRRSNLGFIFQDFNLLDNFLSKIISSFHWCWQERIIRKWMQKYKRLPDSLEL